MLKLIKCEFLKLKRKPLVFISLELYVNKEEKNSTTYKKYETGIEDTYGEGEGRVYESDEDPLDLYSQVEGKIEIKIR